MCFHRCTSELWAPLPPRSAIAAVPAQAVPRRPCGIVPSRCARRYRGAISAPHGKRGTDARLQQRGRRRREAGASPAPVTPGAGAAQPRRGHPVTVLRTEAAPGSRCSVPAGADKPHARRWQGGTAESGGDRRHRRHPSLWVPCVCVCPPSPFPYQ
uniref:Uncharacterized protein n=1 Tax=Geospiza parvula TaxID=87175 RepID=A0A8C3MF41_GEOPR